MYKLPVHIQDLKIASFAEAFDLESGGILPEFTIAYHTYGQLNADRSNVIWVCHALTANSEVADWWAELFGEEQILDSTKYFIVCANILGSCYGSTSPLSINPDSGQMYGKEFPLVSIRDQVKAHYLLMEHLGLKKLHLVIGGSCGGHQAMEMAYDLREKVDQLVLLVTSAYETPWAIAAHESQRMAIESDSSFGTEQQGAGMAGMQAARAAALLHYRSFVSYLERQSEEEEKLTDFRAASYVRYQGEKLVRRFEPLSYWHLTKTLDTHDIGRGRGGRETALSGISARTMIIGMSNDGLIPISEQKFLADHIPQAQFTEIETLFGHDGFLIETSDIHRILRNWLAD